MGRQGVQNTQAKSRTCDEARPASRRRGLGHDHGHPRHAGDVRGVGRRSPTVCDLVDGPAHGAGLPEDHPPLSGAGRGRRRAQHLRYAPGAQPGGRSGDGPGPPAGDPREPHRVRGRGAQRAGQDRGGNAGAGAALPGNRPPTRRPAPGTGEGPTAMKGSLVPLVTPFHDGAFDEAAFRALIEWQIASGSHGLVITGTTGEPSALSGDERRGVIETAIAAVGRRVPVIAATGTNNYAETLELTRFAGRAGAEAALVVVPYYIRPSQEGLYRYFRAIAEGVDIPVIIYNIPGRTAANIEPATIARLARDFRTIIGVKEANKDFEHVNRVLHLCGRGFLVYSGIELLCFPMLAIGGAGHMSATGNVLPRA